MSAQAGVVRNQYFDAVGGKVGSEIAISGSVRVEGDNAGKMPPLSIAVLANDRVVVTWMSESDDAALTDGNGTAVVQTLLHPPYESSGVSGVAEAGAELSLVCTFGTTTTLATTTADAVTGAYSFSGLALVEGVYHVVSTDLAGNQQTQPFYVGSQAAIGAYNVVLQNAVQPDAEAAGLVTDATQAQYEAMGVFGLNTDAKVGLMGDVIDHLSVPDVDAMAELHALALAVEKTMLGTVTVGELSLMGLDTDSITDDNWLAVQGELALSAPSDKDSLAEIQALIFLQTREDLSIMQVL